MKKNVLAIMTALFLFALLLPAARATDAALAVLYDDGTLVFQDDATPQGGKTVQQTYTVDLTASESPLPWHDEREGIFAVDFAASVRPASTRDWFSGFVNLEYVHNIENLDTSADTDMAGMFEGCETLRALDLSGFDTANVADMSGMFRDATGLLSLDLSAFDTASVTDMSGMFQRCTALTEIDLRNFSADSLENAASMFDSCSSLRKIYASDRFDASSVQSGDDMFADCRVLLGGNGTRFDRAHTDNAYARLDAADAPGYFSARGPVVYYTVTWKNEDDTTLKTEEVAYGTTPTYSGNAPVKIGYVFAGWEPDPAPLYEDTTYTAQFIPAVCTVTWADEDGTVLQTTEVPSRTVPVYSGETPAKPGHIFAGWEPEPAPVTVDTTYTARFTPAVCTVTWTDEDGTVLQTEEVASGTTPAYSGETPTKPEHVFAGWEPEPAPVVVDTTYTARFTRVVRPFDVGTDAYSFGNGMDDFGYSAGQYPIPPQSVFVIFGDTMLGRLIYTRMAAGEWGGNCVGMTASAALFYAGNVSPADFGKENVRALEIGDSNDEITVLRFIEAMQAAQYTEAFAQARHDHAFQPGESLLPLVETVRDAAELGQPTLIAITKDGVGGRALLAFGVEGETDAGAQLQVYDCNRPGELRHLTIQDTSAWTYDMGDYGLWGGEGCSIAYVPFETLESIWENRGDPRAVNETLTVNVGNLSITNAQGEEVASLVDGRLVTDRDDIYAMPELSMYWPDERTIFLPKGLYTLTSGDDADLTATMTDQHMSASITTSANTVSFDVDDDYMLNTVAVVDAAKTDTYSVSLESDFEGMFCQNVSLEGTGQGRTLAVSMNQDAMPLVSNCGDAALSIDDVPQTTHTVTATAGAGGTVTPAGDTSVLAGADATFAFTPNPGYNVRSIRVDGADIGPRFNYTFQNVTGNHVLSVLFEQSL
ncbi:MAG: BspA family leucine-rich repeat surface protein, partial [Oscillibacter sp.]|nr:BspA family leucine-rich repeat surface protein [Oscillibacter sp.]